jgi:hypothetical protein
MATLQRRIPGWVVSLSAGRSRALIQRYEAIKYQVASFERVQEIMRVLGVSLRRPAALRLAS